MMIAFSQPFILCFRSISKTMSAESPTASRTAKIEIMAYFTRDVYTD